MNDEHLIPLLERYAASRDPALRDELFEHYLPLARAVARKFSGRGVETEDLEQVAGMALLKALERFDPARGFRFVTYAVPTITGDVRNYLRDKSGLMRMPRDMRQRLYQMTQEQERFEREHLRTPTAVELSERMGIAPEEFLALLALRTQNEAVSLDTPVGEEGDTQLSDLLGSTDDRFERMERSEWAQWLLSKVGDTERELLTLRYRDGLGQRETARRLGISQMQVSRLERRALSRLRAMEAQA
ncbi:MAG TPA: sigma-70 family RNA polymerase sigma factor [Candidatus Limiplasma merdipullorum]|jgi:RNA polymerase sigma-B factor|nr:sigma-70 family RNA polymerase sigma factor [Candidatus Limiplasma merdipullorum]